MSILARELHKKALPGVLMIQVRDDVDVLFTSTGFVADDRKQVLTSYHSIAHASRIISVDGNETVTNLQVQAADPALDLAILSPVEEEMENFAHLVPLKLAASSALSAGSRVYAIGFARKATAGHPLLESGRFLAMRTETPIRDASNYLPRNLRLIAANFPGKPGLSGGPLLSDAGEVVGVVHSRQHQYSNAIPIEAAREFLALKGVNRSKFFLLRDGFKRLFMGAKTEANLGLLYEQAHNYVFQIAPRGNEGAPQRATAFSVDCDHLLTAYEAAPQEGTEYLLSRSGVWEDLVQVKQTFPRIGLSLLARVKEKSSPFVGAVDFTGKFGGKACLEPLVAMGFPVGKAQMFFSLGRFHSTNVDRARIDAEEGFVGAPLINMQGQFRAMICRTARRSSFVDLTGSIAVQSVLQQAGLRLAA